jgi:RNA polymerase sigma factor (sigma-70 family)
LNTITGDPAADAKLGARVHYTLAANGVRRDDIEDCAQEVMLALLTTGSAVRDVTSYACGTARNLAIHEIRRMAHQRTHGDMALVERTPSHEPDALTLLQRRQTLAIANSVLRAIPRPRRELLVRFYIRGEAMRDICAALGITPTQFRLEKSRAKAQFLDRVARAQTLREAA